MFDRTGSSGCAFVAYGSSGDDTQLLRFLLLNKCQPPEGPGLLSWVGADRFYSNVTYFYIQFPFVYTIWANNS